MNISIKAGILPVALLNTVAMTAANDSIVWKRQVYSTGHVRFRQEVLASPAMRNYLHTPSISEFSVYATTEPAAAARIPQLGRGGKQFGMEASSFQQLGANSVVWGKASYQNGKKYDVTWNETSDFLLLYPYVMGDAKGATKTTRAIGSTGDTPHDTERHAMVWTWDTGLCRNTATVTLDPTIRWPTCMPKAESDSTSGEAIAWH